MRVVRIAITQAVCTIVTLITPLVSNPSGKTQPYSKRMAV